MLYRGAEALLESGAVECAEWDPPILRGQVVVDGERFCPELNLRSTVFAENKCSCLAGRRRQICVHAIACALYYQAIQSEDAHERLAQAHLKNSVLAQEESAALPEKRPLQLLKIGQQGTSLELRWFIYRQTWPPRSLEMRLSLNWRQFMSAKRSRWVSWIIKEFLAASHLP